MTLATVGADGRPSTRIVLVKGVDARGLVWYTNYDSRKGRELAHEPHAALQFHWVELERVVRIEGQVEKVSRRGIRRLLRHASTRLANRGLGLTAKPADHLARGVGGQRRQSRCTPRLEPAAPAALGRLSPGSRSLGVLAGSPQPSARSCALYPGGGALAAPASGSLTQHPRQALRQPRRECLAELRDLGADHKRTVALTRVACEVVLVIVLGRPIVIKRLQLGDHATLDLGIQLRRSPIARRARCVSS